MKNIWKNKKVLVTGSEGMIGKELVIQLHKLGANIALWDIKYWYKDRNVKEGMRPMDITYKDIVERSISKVNPEIIFHLAGVKGNPKMTKEKPVDFMGPMLQFDTNMILVAQKYGVKRFLYTSSIAVENPESDKYPAWAKQTAETLIEAMRIQYPKTKYCIVRPANVYGKEDLSRDNLMVVSGLIKAGLKDKKLILDKKGSTQIRDLIHAKDVAR